MHIVMAVAAEVLPVGTIRSVIVMIAVAMMDTLGPQERFEEAQSWLAEASELREHLEGVDRDRVDTAVKRAANDLQRLITRASVS